MEMPASTVAARILVVEDDASLLRFLEMRLSADGYDTRVACDGVDALEVLSAWIPDVVVTDVMMPRLSGLSLCREIRGAERTATTPVILLTARNFDSDMQEVVDLGGVTFMNKPFNWESLSAALKSALASRVATPSAVGAEHSS